MCERNGYGCYSIKEAPIYFTQETHSGEQPVGVNGLREG